MKILYLDFLYPKGHICQNETYINLLSNISTVYVLGSNRYYKSLNRNIKLIKKKFLLLEGKALLSRLNSLIIMLVSSIVARKIKPNYIFVSSYETIVFAFGIFFFKKGSKIFLLHHRNIDELDNLYKKKFFMSYANKVLHVVFDEFIKEYIITTFNIDKKYVYVLPHQMNKYEPKHEKGRIFDCVGLSNSNDENMVMEIVNLEIERKIFIKLKLKIILKSNLIEYDDGYLKVVKGFLSDDEYSYYISSCKCIYMPFPKTFKYRASGTLIDALSSNKIVLGTDIPIMQQYTKKYPSICKIIYQFEDFVEQLINLDDDNTERDFNLFRENHSSKIIIKKMEKIFRG